MRLRSSAIPSRARGAATGAPNKEQRTRVAAQLQWDGKAITGAINPGPNAVPLTKASLDPDTWQVHLEAEGKEPRRGPCIVIDGKLENIGSARRVLTARGRRAGQKGDFQIDPELTDVSLSPKIGWPKSSVSRCRYLLFSWQMYSVSSPLGAPRNVPRAPSTASCRRRDRRWCAS